MSLTPNEQVAYIKSRVAEYVKFVEDAKRIIDESSEYYRIEAAKKQLAIYQQVGQEYRRELTSLFPQLDQMQTELTSLGLPEYVSRTEEVAAAIQRLIDASRE
jgi:hypothetical protein